MLMAHPEIDRLPEFGWDVEEFVQTISGAKFKPTESGTVPLPKKNSANFADSAKFA